MGVLLGLGKSRMVGEAGRVEEDVLYQAGKPRDSELV